MYRAIDRREKRSLRKKSFWSRRTTQLERPRLCVFRSARHIQAQIIDDTTEKVIASASSMEKSLRSEGKRGKDMAAQIGALVAERAKAKGIAAVVFDRNGFAYHGRVQALADGARNAGLDF